MKLFKVASFDIGNFQLINAILKTKKPTIISTGMAKLTQIDKVYKSYMKKVDLTILHCISSYPNKEVSSYLKNIEFFKKRYACKIGISDHTSGIKIPIYANLMGAEGYRKTPKIKQ